MADIIKTWPAFMEARKVAEIFSSLAPPFGRYYFALGRGRPKQEVERVWFTWRGRILGWFALDELVVNDGSLPRLRSLSGEESEWQIRKDAWVAICRPGCQRLKERVFMDGFRGWRYFNFEGWKSQPEARIRG